MSEHAIFDPVRPAQPSRVLPERADLVLRHLEGDEWDAQAIGFRDVLHEQTHCFNAARWGAANCECLAAFDGRRVVGGAVIVFKTLPVIGRRVAVVKWGPLWRMAGDPDDPQRLRRILVLLKQEYGERRGMFLTVMPRADAEIAPLETATLESLGFLKGPLEDSPDRYFVNTSITLQAMRASLGQKWRYNLKKAERNGLTSELVEGARGLDAFMALYDGMLRRKQFLDTSPIFTLPALMRASHDPLRPRTLLVRKDDEVVAGAVLDLAGERAIYLYGATSERALPLKAGYVMHWQIASMLAADPAVRWYDLGGADLESGLEQFKRAFVGKEGVITATPPIYHYGATACARMLGTTALSWRKHKGRLRRLLHDRLTGAAA